MAKPPFIATYCFILTLLVANTNAMQGTAQFDLSVFVRSQFAAFVDSQFGNENDQAAAEKENNHQSVNLQEARDQLADFIENEMSDLVSAEFTRLDSLEENHLNFDKFKELFTSIIKATPLPHVFDEEISYIYEIGDTDGSGNLDRAEVIMAIRAYLKERLKVLDNKLGQVNRATQNALFVQIAQEANKEEGEGKNQDTNNKQQQDDENKSQKNQPFSQQPFFMNALGKALNLADDNLERVTEEAKRIKDLLDSDEEPVHYFVGKTFDELDSDKDKFLQLGEFRALLQSLCKEFDIRQPYEFEVRTFFQKQDLEASGFIGYDFVLNGALGFLGKIYQNSACLDDEADLDSPIMSSSDKASKEIDNSGGMDQSQPTEMTTDESVSLIEAAAKILYLQMREKDEQLELIAEDDENLATLEQYISKVTSLLENTDVIESEVKKAFIAINSEGDEDTEHLNRHEYLSFVIRITHTFGLPIAKREDIDGSYDVVDVDKSGGIDLLEARNSVIEYLQLVLQELNEAYHADAAYRRDFFDQYHFDAHNLGEK